MAGAPAWDAALYGASRAPVPPPAREPLLPLARSVNEKCTTLCPVLDAFLRGGVPTRSLTEIAGEAGSAKTQLCLQLLLAAQLPRHLGGLGGAAVYVHTEGRAPTTRLRQLAAKHPALAGARPAEAFLDDVFLVKSLDDADGLWNALASLAAILREPPGGPNRPVRLVIVDSVSSPFRDAGSEGGDDGDVGAAALRRDHPSRRSFSGFSARRASALTRVSALLREYAHKHDVAVVVTNHVRDEFEDDKRGDKGSNLGGGGGGGNRHSYAKPNGGASLRDALGPAGRTRAGGRDATPTLGLHWANCVNSRIFLSRDRSAGVGGGEVRRSARVVFSSHLPTEGERGGLYETPFEVTAEGVRGTTTGIDHRNEREPLL